MHFAFIIFSVASLYLILFFFLSELHLIHILDLHEYTSSKECEYMYIHKRMCIHKHKYICNYADIYIVNKTYTIYVCTYEIC